MTVRYVPREDEASSVILAEEADIAFLCSHMYLDLRDSGLVEGLVVPVIDGRSEATMQLVVRAEDAGTTFEDLAGSTVGIGQAELRHVAQGTELQQCRPNWLFFVCLLLDVEGNPLTSKIGLDSVEIGTPLELGIGFLRQKIQVFGKTI